MPLNKKHYLPNEKDRESKWYHPVYKMGGKSAKEFQRIEDLLDEMTCDLVNGKAKSEIILKAQNGLYENQKKGVEYREASEYYKAILSRLQIDEPDKDNAKSAFYSMYLNIYREQLEEGNLMGAKATLDSMVKLMGLDKPTNAIQVNNSSDKVEIKFGFSE